MEYRKRCVVTSVSFREVKNVFTRNQQTTRSLSLFDLLLQPIPDIFVTFLLVLFDLLIANKWAVDAH